MEHIDLQTQLSRVQRRALVVGLAGGALAAVGFFSQRAQFYQSYHMAYLYWLGLAGGGLAILLLHHLVSGRWGYVIQRPLEAAAKTIPLMALFFLPICFGLHDLFEWTHEEAAHDHVLQKKLAYLNEGAFLLRAAIYFLVWTLLGFTLSAWSARQDTAADPAVFHRRLRWLSGPALVLYMLTMSFASWDWGMSVEPHWYSTMYGPHFIVGQGLLTLCFMAILANRLSRRKPLMHVITHQQFHDIGNLMFALTIFWTYVSIGELIIIWSGNLPEETVWYMHRVRGGWTWVAVILALFGFLLPFLLLLNKSMKRHGGRLARIAIWIMIMRAVDVFWRIEPAFRDEVRVHWLDFACLAGLGGLWIAAFLAFLKSRPLLPAGDPRFTQLLASAHAAEHSAA